MIQKDKVFTNDKEFKLLTNDPKRIKCSQIIKKRLSVHK